MIIQCPNCQQNYDAPVDMAGQTVECACGVVLEIPLQTVKAEVLDQVPAKKQAYCIHCGSPVIESAPRCPHCGKFHAQKEQAPHPNQFIKNNRIKVDTGENVLNRNRGCADIIIFGPIVLVVFLVLLGGC